MCRSKADGGRRCPSDGQTRPAGITAPAGSPDPGERLAAELGAATAGLGQGGDAQYALEATADLLRRAYVNAGRLGPLDAAAEALRAQMLGIAETINAGLDDEHAGRQYLREDVQARLRSLAGTTGTPIAEQPRGITEDDADYLRRAAELDRRVAGGESITDIMAAEQLERGKAMIRSMTWP